MSGEPVHEPWHTVTLRATERGASLISMCHGTVIRIEVLINDLRTTERQVSSLSCQLRKFLDRSCDPKAMKDLESWMATPCIEHFKKFFPTGSLQEYFHIRVSFFYIEFRLKNIQGLLTAVHRPIKPSATTRLTLRVSEFNRAVSFARQQGMRCISASQIQIVPNDLVPTEHNGGMPRLVRIAGEDDLSFFKAAMDRDCFEREVSILTRIANMDPDKTLRTTRLVGLVQWDTDGSIAGLLIEYMAGAETLPVAAQDALPLARHGWITQLEATMSRLHEAGIIWGDAAAHNVLVDPQGQAWVTDFDYGRYHTQEGDLEELTKIIDFLKSGLGWFEWNAKK